MRSGNGSLQFSWFQATAARAVISIACSGRESGEYTGVEEVHAQVARNQVAPKQLATSMDHPILAWKRTHFPMTEGRCFGGQG